MPDNPRLIWSATGIEVYLLDQDRYRGLTLLSDDELDRATLLRTGIERKRFSARRSMLRSLIAKRCEVDPASLRFQYGRKGKPYLPDSTIRFNASHSGPFGIVAISDQFEVGVDIQISTDSETLRLGLDRFLTPAEREEIQSAGEYLNVLLHQLWTRKEASAKAIGIGLSTNLSLLNAGQNATEWLSRMINLDNLSPSPEWFGAICWFETDTP